MQELIELVRQASPTVWAAAQQKVTALLVADVFWLAICVVVFVGVGRLVPVADGGYDGWEGERRVARAAGKFLSAIGALFCVGDALCVLVAWDWYAIETIAKLAK
jgi:hypothetical protein